MRRALLGVAVLLVLLVVGDRVAATVAAHVMASRVQQSQGLPTRPSVSIGGFPFLTQALFGDYAHVRAVVSHLRRGGLDVTRIDADLDGVAVPFGDVVAGTVDRVPVDSLRVRAKVDYASLDRYLAGR